MKTNLSIILSLLFLSLVASSAKTKLSHGETGDYVTDNGILFTENKGQVYNQNHNPRPDVLYGAESGPMAVHIRNTGISYQLSKVGSYQQIEDPITHLKKPVAERINVHRIDLTWLNAKTDFINTTGETTQGFANYYFEHCSRGIEKVKSFKDVTLKNIYNGVDVHYYSKNGVLKHDYLVAPHADYRQIRIKVSGAQIEKSSDGSLILATALGRVQEGAPVVFQNGKQLKARWRVEKDVLSFAIEGYDPNVKLIVDPITRLWGTYYGGNGIDGVNAVTTDGAGDVYITGDASSFNGTVIATTGSHQQSIGSTNDYDAFLAKFSSSGQRIWATYYGSIGYDGSRSCAIDASLNVYMTGYTHSGLSTGTTIATPAAHQPTAGGLSDAFLVKFNSSGVRQWATYYGETGSDAGAGCCCDASGNVYMVGSTGTTNSSVIATPGCHQGSLQGFGGSNAFIVKFSGAGVRLWGTYYGGNTDGANFCATDGGGNLFVSGQTSTSTSSLIATAGVHQTSYSGNYDGFLVKFDAAGVRQWGTYYGGSAFENATSCTIDASGNIYMSGITASGTGTAISSAGSHQSVYGGGTYDGFLAKFNSVGQRVWGTYYGGNGSDALSSTFLDANNDVYVAGNTASGAGTSIATAGAYQFNLGGNDDGLLAKFNALGQRQWGTYFGGSGNEGARAAHNSGNIYLAGATGSGTAIATPGSHQPAIGGTFTNGFLVKLKDCVAFTATAAVNSSVCSGSALSFSAGSTGTSVPVYSWIGPGNFNSAQQNPVIPAAPASASGIYTLLADNSGCVEQATVSVLIYPLPTITVNSGVICGSGNYTVTPAGAFTYTIQGGSLVVSPTISTSYTVSGTSADGCLSANPATVFITVSTLPTITVNSGTICAGKSFTIVPQGAVSYTYQGGSAVVTPSVSTGYTLSGANADGCKSANSLTVNVAVNALPLISVSSSKSQICEGETATLTASGALSYSFSPGISGSVSVVSPSSTLVYTISGSDANGCSNFTTITQAVFPCTDVEKNEETQVHQLIWPNPNNGKFTINCAEKFPSKCRILNAAGALLIDDTIYNTDTRLDLSELPDGIYFFELEQSGRVLRDKLVKF